MQDIFHYYIQNSCYINCPIDLKKKMRKKSILISVKIKATRSNKSIMTLEIWDILDKMFASTIRFFKIFLLEQWELEQITVGTCT